MVKMVKIWEKMVKHGETMRKTCGISHGFSRIEKLGGLKQGKNPVDLQKWGLNRRNAGY
jgi:hypothetical protein